jgi:hypothetical protein
VRELNFFLAGGVPTEPEPVYGRTDRGNVDRIGNRSELGEDYTDVDLTRERRYKVLHYDFEKRSFRREVLPSEIQGEQLIKRERAER